MEGSNEVFPNQPTRQPLDRNFAQFEKTCQLATVSYDSAVSGSRRKFQAATDVSNSHRRTLSDPNSSATCVASRQKSIHTAHHSRPTNMDPPSVLQSKISPVLPPPNKEIASKCNICEYRSSIEKWHFPDGLIFCPNCLHIEAPLLRTKTKKAQPFLRSSFGLNCILHCWPLCFLPFLSSPPLQNSLHCPQCFTFLGMYDERLRCIQPSHEFVDYNGCFSAEESRRRTNQQEEQRWKDDMFMRQIY